MPNPQEIHEDNIILAYFTAKNGQKYQAHFAHEKHAESIVELFQDIYGWHYLYPFVYSVEEIKTEIKDPQQFWCIVTPQESDEVVGLSVIKMNEISLEVSKVNIKRKYQSLGIGRVLGANAFTTLIGNSIFRNIQRLNSDVRAVNLHSQIFIEKTGSKPYGFIPNYNNYGNKRHYSPTKGDPFIEGRIEPVIMYASRFNSLWEIRNTTITLFDNEDILFHYNIAKNNNRKMKKDIVTIEETCNLELNQFTINEDFYKGCVKFEGYINEDTLNELLQRYNNWNVIEWRIPVNTKGIDSQKTAIEKRFVVTGYDPGSILLNKLHDVLLVCKFPNKVDPSQFKHMNLTPTNKKIAERVIDSL